MPMIHRVRIKRVNADMSETDVFVFRMGGSQADAEAFGNRLRTRWMVANPGWATTMTTDWPTSEELGGKHVMPKRDEIDYGPFMRLE